MNSLKFLRFYLFSFVILLLIASNVFGEDDPWLLLHRGKGNDADVYYNKDTIIKIDDNIREVFIQVVSTENKYTVQQVRIDCKNNETSIGKSDVYIRNVKTQSLDFGKFKWIWSAPRNSADKKLINLVCKKKWPPPYR
jgi:hypothetical protein